VRSSLYTIRKACSASSVGTRSTTDHATTNDFVLKNTRIDAERDLFVCVRVLFKASKRLGDYPESLRLDDRGISWAKGWNSSAANALRVKAALT